MDYPLNVSLPAPAIGFAVANDADEHERLSEMGYQPKFEKSPTAEKPAVDASNDTERADADGDGKLTKDEVVAELDRLGIKHDKRSSLKDLTAMLPKKV